MGTIKTIAAAVKSGDVIRDNMQGRLRLVVANTDEAGRRLIYTHEGYFSLKNSEPVEVITGMTRAQVDAANKYL